MPDAEDVVEGPDHRQVAGHGQPRDQADRGLAVLDRQRLAQLLELVWGYDFAADTNVVDVFIGYLRRKLEAGGAPRLLHTVRGVGFVLRTQ